jgi:hypothetical protein
MQARQRIAHHKSSQVFRGHHGKYARRENNEENDAAQPTTQREELKKSECCRHFLCSFLVRSKIEIWNLNLKFHCDPSSQRISR